MVVPLFRRLAFPPRRAGSVLSRWKSTERFNEKDFVVAPWYVKEASNLTPKDQLKKETDVQLPPDSPNSLLKIAEFAAHDMGLKDVMVIDQRGELESGALGPALIVLGTGSSTRHLGSAGTLLVSWLKKQFGIHADREGILTTNFLKLQNRRQKKKQQRQRMASPTETTLNKVAPWIVVDTKLDNIYVHAMTPDRRKEVDLEGLRALHADMSTSGEADNTVEDLFSDPTPTGVKEASLPTGRRDYSTLSKVHTNREELALENLVEEKREDLTDRSVEVENFVSLFPQNPTREDWKRRLRFFAIAAIQSPAFPLNRVLVEADNQQASGFVLDEEDIEMVASAICYHGQSYYSKLVQTDETMTLWNDLCDQKAQLFVDLYDLTFRPTGRTMLDNPRLLVLMYRAFTGLSASSATPSTVLANPFSANEQLGVYFDSRRLHPLRYLIETTEEIRSPQTVAMILSSLVNKGLYDAFWKVANLAIVSSSDIEAAEQIAEVSASLIIRSENPEQIKFTVQSFLPNAITTKKLRLTPRIERLLNAEDNTLKLNLP